jgi:hypothetical protein
MGLRHLTRSVLLAASLLASQAEAVPFAERSAPARVAYTTVAAVANVVPVVSTIYAPRCLPGYVVCKLLFAGASLVAVTEQLVTSGGADWTQTRAILHRGFDGDWVLTGAHVAGDRTPEPWPEPRSTAAETGSGWQPPPL